MIMRECVSQEENEENKNMNILIKFFILALLWLTYFRMGLRSTNGD